MATRPVKNPIRRYKDRENLTYAALAERLGIGEDYARKLGSPGGVKSVSPGMAQQFDARTNGGIAYLDVMRWIAAHIPSVAADDTAASGS